MSLRVLTALLWIETTTSIVSTTVTTQSESTAETEKLLLTLGREDKPGEPGKPFNKPTDLAVSPQGELFITDGYGNSRVHRFTQEGELIKSWGDPGTGPGQFNIPHGVWADRKRVYVADRQNNRIQIFTHDGEYIEKWGGFDLPCDIYIDDQNRVYVPELRSRLSILNLKGEVLLRIGGTNLKIPGEFVAPHCVWKDSKNAFYVGEALEGQRIQKFVPG